MAGAQAGHDEEGQVVIVVSGGLAAAGERADRLRDRFAVAGRGHDVAIGLSSTATHGRSFGELLRAARQAALNVRDSSRVVAAAELRTVVGR
jgi:alkanesulfonate monooxygenase SsuD/methylene tetrahydromethanopterin reductase-like flavin-dependent oxidoreductase (luciferase family)